jgi:flagellar biosynthesis/type III secretory pathway protein FliH
LPPENFQDGHEEGVQQQEVKKEAVTTMAKETMDAVSEMVPSVESMQ